MHGATMRIVIMKILIDFFLLLATKSLAEFNFISHVYLKTLSSLADE